VIVAITCIDVAGAKIFRWRLLGAIDLVMLCQLVVIASAAGMTLIKDRHTRVEFFFKLLPPRVQNMVDTFVYLLVLGLFSAVIWRVCILGYSFQTSGESSGTIYIPYYPFAYGLALACIPVWLITLVHLVKSFRKSVLK
jgi:TRAP-type C4-dicarboxylate transport system permease small subunit